jgi:hypothetical protein
MYELIIHIHTHSLYHDDNTDDDDDDSEDKEWTRKAKLEPVFNSEHVMNTYVGVEVNSHVF